MRSSIADRRSKLSSVQFIKLSVNLMAASKKLKQIQERLKTIIVTLEDVKFGDRKLDDATTAFVQDTPEEKALRRKVEWHQMPSVWILYL